MSSDNVEASVTRPPGECPRAKSLRRAARITDGVFCACYVPIVMVLLLDLLGVDPQNSFVKFWEAVATPFVAPFQSLVTSRLLEDYQVMWGCLAALFVYLVVHQTITALLEVAAERPSTNS